MLRRNSLLPSPSFLAIAILTTAFVALPAQAGDGGYSYARIVRLSLVKGDVQMVRSGESKWEPALMNMPVQQGFTLGTNDGIAEVEFENGGMVWLDEKSVLQFTELALSNSGRITRLTLAQGRATFSANGGAADIFDVNTQTFQIVSSHKSEFRVDAVREGGSIAVFKGKISVDSLAGKKDLEHGKTFSINSKKPDDAAVKQNTKPDDWDKWVTSRSTLLESGQNQTAQHTNAPFSYGMADLSSYGSWSFFPGFGYGWQPFAISSGWAPFSAGQWDFYQGLGWTWLSTEPWGWVPYHFGQWAYSPAFGWMWTPGGYGFWSSAPVQWMTVGKRVGWVPANAIRSASSSTSATGVPVVVATKDLGKGGTNHILTPQQAARKAELITADPRASGAATAPVPGTARFVVPTAANLESLHGGVSFDTQQRRFVNAVVASSTPPLHPVAVNGMPPARKLSPSLPPARTPSASSLNDHGFHSEGPGAASIAMERATGSSSSSATSAGRSSGGGKSAH